MRAAWKSESEEWRLLSLRARGAKVHTSLRFRALREWTGSNRGEDGGADGITGRRGKR
jgi:hypothetical protein